MMFTSCESHIYSTVRWASLYMLVCICVCVYTFGDCQSVEEINYQLHVGQYLCQRINSAKTYCFRNPSVFSALKLPSFALNANRLLCQAAFAHFTQILGPLANRYRI